LFLEWMLFGRRRLRMLPPAALAQSPAAREEELVSK
jgi:hypothetical protein